MVGQRLSGASNLLPKVVVDSFAFTLSLVIAWLVRFEEVPGGIPPKWVDVLWMVLPIALGLKLILFTLFRCYGSLWRYSSLADLFRLAQATFASSICLAALEYFTNLRVPLGVLLLDGLLTLFLCGAARMAPRFLRDRLGPVKEWEAAKVFHWLFHRRSETIGRRVLIIGAGDAGESLVREMIRMQPLGYVPVGFVDDDPSKKGLMIHGVKVRGSRNDISRLVQMHKVDEVLIAIPSATTDEIHPIVQACRGTGVKLKILPDLASLVHGTPRLADIRELRIEDLLGRPKIDLNLDNVSAYIKGKRVLVTGAGGSIGSELCRQILRYQPAEIQLFGRGENSIYAIYQELAPRQGDTRLYQLIGDVINRSKLIGLFERFHPEIVFHAGADKHVPLMELNPDEAVLNNIIGTRNVIETCEQYGVERVVCISTDKAVNPTSVMGCCKRVAEFYIQSGRFTKTIVTGVRFGNVLGSRGSVIPLFQHQIERGGPVTVTHQKIRRYFMSIPEAVALVIQAGAMAHGGEIFVLDMGDPVYIDELARRVIRLHGLEPDKDIPVVYVGLRPGEKLDEELIGVGESREPTAHPKIFKAISHNGTPNGLDELVAQLARQAVAMDDAGIRATLCELVKEYQPYLPPEVQSWAARRQD